MQPVFDHGNVYMATGGVDWQEGQPVLCFVHGSSLDRTVWTLFSRYFARAGYNVMAVDLPGHGKSRSALLPTIEAMADWLNGLLDQVVAERVILVGHSMGSLVTLETAARVPKRVSHLALLGTAVPMPVGEVLLDAARKNSPLARQIVATLGHSYASQLGGNPVSGISVMNLALALMAKAGDGVMYNDMRACNEYTNGLEAASKVTARTTLVVGSEDKMTSSKAAPNLAESFENATIEYIQCGHMMMAERPEDTLQALLRAIVR